MLIIEGYDDKEDVHGAISTSQGDDQTPPEDMAGGGGSGIEYPKDDINPDDIPF